MLALIQMEIQDQECVTNGGKKTKEKHLKKLPRNGIQNGPTNPSVHHLKIVL